MAEKVTKRPEHLATARIFKVGIVDFNPNRFTKEEIAERRMTPQEALLYGDRRQYPLKIGSLLPENVKWFDPDEPWFYQESLTRERISRLENKDACILTGSSLSAYQYQQGEREKIGEENAKLIDDFKMKIPSFIEQGIPILGICFGGQIAAHCLGGTLGTLNKVEAGLLPHRLTKTGREDPVFDYLPEKFYAPHLHSDYVATLPEVGHTIKINDKKIVVRKSQVLVKKDNYIHAYIIKFDNGCFVYGVQFHPEMATEKYANFLVEANRHWLEDVINIEEALEISEEANFDVNQIIPRFVETARKYRRELLDTSYSREEIRPKLRKDLML